MNTDSEFYTMTDLALMLNGINRRLERLEQILTERPEIIASKSPENESFKANFLKFENGGLGGIIGGEKKGDIKGKKEGGKKGGERGDANDPDGVFTLIAKTCHGFMLPYLNEIEAKRLQGGPGMMAAAKEVRKLMKSGYTEAQIVQAVKDATNEPFWRPNFRSLLKLSRKNRDGTPYIDVFLALNQKHHKLPTNRPRIIV